jgi:hypothetical protein
MQMQRVMVADEDELGMMTGTIIIHLPHAPKLKSHHPPPKPPSLLHS